MNIGASPSGKAVDSDSTIPRVQILPPQPQAHQPAWLCGLIFFIPEKSPNNSRYFISERFVQGLLWLYLPHVGKGDCKYSMLSGHCCDRDGELFLVCLSPHWLRGLRANGGNHEFVSLADPLQWQIYDYAYRWMCNGAGVHRRKFCNHRRTVLRRLFAVPYVRLVFLSVA